MDINVTLLGPEARTLGKGSVAVSLAQGATCADLLTALGQALPDLGWNRTHYRIAINHDFAPPDAVVTEDDEVALIGLVSGG